MKLSCTANAVLTVAVLATGICDKAHAQTPSGQAEPVEQSGWSFNVAPYIWLPGVNANLNYSLPSALAGRLPTDVSTGPGEYLSKLHFAAMIAGGVRYDRFSLTTDFIYVSGAAGTTTIRSLDFFGQPSLPISRSLQTSTSSSLKATVWTLTGGYTVLKGDLGDLDLIVGLRYLGVNANTNYNLALTVAGPRGNGATFGGSGGVSGALHLWDGIGGFRGRIRLGDTPLYVPYYFDIGAGGSDLTWQISAGLGYRFSWGDISVQYRHLSFTQGNSALVKHLYMSGPMIMADFTF